MLGQMNPHLAGKAVLAVDPGLTVEGQHALDSVLEDFRGEGAHLHAGMGGVGDAVDDAAAAHRADIEGDLVGVISESFDLLDGVSDLQDGVGALGVVVAGVRRTPGDFDLVSGTALPGNDQRDSIGTGGAAFENKAGRLMTIRF